MAGLLAVVTNDELQARQDAQVAELYAQATGANRDEEVVRALDAYIERCWQAAKQAKESGAEADMLEDIRQREGKYDPAKLAEIRKQGGSEVYMLLTNEKCRAAEGWIRDILLPSGERPFTVRPSPVPDDLPDDVKVGIYQRAMQELQQALQSGIYVQPQQVYERARSLSDEVAQKLRDEAKTRAHRMENAIDDVFVEGQWYEAMSDMISDLVCLPSAFIKGPVIRKNRKLAWRADANGNQMPMAVDELTPVFYSPNPLDIYPAPNSRGIDDGYLCERIAMRRSALYAMIGVPGYKEDAIRQALASYQHHGATLAVSGDQQRRELENAPQWQMSPDTTIDAIEFHGSARGEWLRDWGMSETDIPDPDADYEVTVLKVGLYTVRCVLNEDPLRRRPYVQASYDVLKGQFWGCGLSRMLRDLQGVCNAAARAMVNNMGIASGPLVEIEVDRLAEGEDATQIYPWRIIQTKRSSSAPAPAVRYTQPTSVVNDLMKVYDYYSKMASNYSGIPDYEQGVNPTRGAAGTASGLSMLMTASSRQIKRVIAGIDAMTEGCAQRVHTHLMLYGDDPATKGDANIEARGAASLVAKEQQQIRRQQFMAASLNPIDAQIIGPMGRAELLRATLRSLDIDPDDIVPTKDDMMAKLKAASMQAMPGPGQPGQPQPEPPAMDAAGAPAGGQSHALFAQG